VTARVVAIRPATPADLDRIVAWGHDFFEHMRAVTADPWFEGAALDAAALAAKLRESLERGDLLTIAEFDGLPAGYLYGVFERPFIRESPIERVGHVAHVWVEPRARGGGVARAMIADAEAWFRERKVGWLELSYSTANHAGVAAWTTLGFEPHRVYARKRI
jgi:GNAT superfamily N-acetyltransferase